MDTGALIIFLISCGLLGAALVAAYFILQERRRVWSELAAQTGLGFEPGNYWGRTMSVAGTYRGRALKLDTFRVRVGKNNSVFTRIVVQIENRPGLRLALNRQGLGRKIGKLLGQTEIQTGDDELDRLYFIKGQPEALVVRLLASGYLRQKLLATSFNNLNVEGPAVSYEKRGFQTDSEALLSIFGLLSDMADTIERM
jgi:hypothetical protein